MLPRVHVVATGGTIASTPGEDGAAPSISGEDLVDSVPELESQADLSVESVSQVPGFDVDLGIMAKVGEAAREAVKNDKDTIVVTHGTDTLAETAYFLDLTLSLPIPVVVTGAQRRLDEPSSDAPANLLAAVRSATHHRVGEGVFVAFDGELHAARDVRKVHTHKLAAFDSPNDGPVATLTRDSVRFHREPDSESVFVPASETDAEVEIVLSGAGVSGAQIERAVDAGVSGLIVAGTGLGNVTSELGEAIENAIDSGIPVVVTSRCHAGQTGAVYGTPGGGQTLQELGVIPGGDLPPWKARVKLALAVQATDETAEEERIEEIGKFFGSV